MLNIVHHVKRHAKTLGCHVQKHHKKYLFGIFGGFAVVKMLIFFAAGVGVFNYSHSTFADVESGCVMTGEYYTGEVQECTTIPGYYTGETEECTTIPGYYTGDTLDVSGNAIDQIYVDTGENCIITGGIYVTTGENCVTTGGYRTGGTLLCPETGGIITGAGNTGNTGLGLQGLTGNDGICTSGDITWLSPLASAKVKGVINFSWAYLNNDCLSGAKLFTLQLYDHNQQWVPLGTLSSLATGFTFDSLLLSGYKNVSGLVTSGMYTVLDASGVILYTGVASGNYVDFATGYKIRILDTEENVIYSGGQFTIDNKVPTLTGISLDSSDDVSSYVGVDDEVELIFTASEELSGVEVLIQGTGATLIDEDDLTYTYSQTLDSGFTQGVLSYLVTYTDLAGNTGLVSGTGNLIFDRTAPTVSSITMTGTIASGLKLSFVTNELARQILQYNTSESVITSVTGTSYTTGHEYLFTGVQANTLYMFKFWVNDYIKNSVAYSGTFSVSSTGVITFHYAVYVGTFSTGDLVDLADTLKNEINKFNACKSGIVYKSLSLNVNRNDYTLQIPDFQKSYVKKVVNAFTLLILDKVEENKRLTKSEIEEITKKFDNFLIILKLLRDDDNACKQNLSNYHINQFERTLDEYNLYFK